MVNSYPGFFLSLFAYKPSSSTAYNFTNYAQHAFAQVLLSESLKDVCLKNLSENTALQQSHKKVREMLSKYLRTLRRVLRGCR